MDTVLNDIGLYKNRLITALLNSAEITSLLLGKDTPTDDEVDNLIYTQVFPYLYTDDRQAQVLSYLCFEVDVPRIPTSAIKEMKLIIWTYSHKDGIRYSKKGYLGTTNDILADMVERELRESDRFGIGKLRLDSATYFFPGDKYYGRQMVFTIPDFRLKGR